MGNMERLDEIPVVRRKGADVPVQYSKKSECNTLPFIQNPESQKLANRAPTELSISIRKSSLAENVQRLSLGMTKEHTIKSNQLERESGFTLGIPML